MNCPKCGVSLTPKEALKPCYACGGATDEKISQFAAARQELIDKLADTMDPDNAAEMVDYLLRLYPQKCP